MVKSPLRYPGAKKKVLNRFTQFWEVPHVEYRDVFVGGGSTFFGKPECPRNWLNDYDEEIAAFFISMRDYPEELCNLVMSTKPTVELWRQIKDRDLNTDLEKGFRTLFLNRTTFSGILKGNPIGGIEQKSKYTIDCRWNPVALCEQIRLCSEMLQGVTITALDFSSVIQEAGENVLLYLDPPYYHKGNLLYRQGMTHEDHVRLSDLLKDTEHKFFITYDDCEEVRELYQEWAYLYPASWFYSSSNKKAREVGKELFISNFMISEQIACNFGIGGEN
ncbi:DNA adenine methylase [Brevibacillus parabrevis]|uniref:DNA adenine methylase n=1 Tax=Brevibacillus parabrevis TaxID=54914 RepID=UPI001C24EDD3|nr:DNA adenine methylase [Brevibacillus parabrevis]MBU8711117.1 DNA adenine methylase [Brevibacillus parabrevis]